MFDNQLKIIVSSPLMQINFTIYPCLLRHKIFSIGLIKTVLMKIPQKLCFNKKLPGSHAEVLNHKVSNQPYFTVIATSPKLAVFLEYTRTQLATNFWDQGNLFAKFEVFCQVKR